jgi:hypothetical protein
MDQFIHFMDRKQAPVACILFGTDEIKGKYRMVLILILGLFGSVLALVLITALVFFQVAFRGSEPGIDPRSAPPWQPPLAADHQLYDWAAHTTRNQVQRLTQSRNKSTARRIAQEIGAGMSFAVDQTRCGTAIDSEYHCASCRQQTIAISPPEAIAIVELLQADCPRDIHQIRASASHNSHSYGTVTRNPLELDRRLCPLLLKNDICGARNARPIFCRGWLPDSSGQHNSPLAQTITHAVQESLTQELHTQRLDGTHYELNSALTVAFDTLDVAERWARGETVFVNCRTA